MSGGWIVRPMAAADLDAARATSNAAFGALFGLPDDAEVAIERDRHVISSARESSRVRARLVDRDDRLQTKAMS